jgi:hypothetical protein
MASRAALRLEAAGSTGGAGVGSATGAGASEAGSATGAGSSGAAAGGSAVGSAGSLGGGSAGGASCFVEAAHDTDTPKPAGAISDAAKSTAAEVCRVVSEKFAVHRTNRVMRDSETLPKRAAAGAAREIPWQVRT